MEAGYTSRDLRVIEAATDAHLIEQVPVPSKEPKSKVDIIGGTDEMKVSREMIQHLLEEKLIRIKGEPKLSGKKLEEYRATRRKKNRVARKSRRQNRK